MPIAIDTILFSIVSVAILSAGYYVVNRFNTTKVERFRLIIQYFGGISALLVIYNLYMSMTSNERIEAHRMSYNTLENSKRNYLGPQKELIKLFPESYFLYASMNQDTDLNKSLPKEFNALKRQQVEVYGALRVFQAVEDFITVRKYDTTGTYVWINTFLMWFQSPILQHYWKILAFNNADATNKLINNIIEKSNKLVEIRNKKGELTAQDYNAISKNFNIEL